MIASGVTKSHDAISDSSSSSNVLTFYGASDSSMGEYKSVEGGEVNVGNDEGVTIEKPTSGVATVTPAAYVPFACDDFSDS